MKSNFASVLDSMREEYSALIHSGKSLSIAQFMNSEGCQVEEYCQGFYPHPYGEVLAKGAREFANYHGIWLDNGDSYITCAIYLNPRGQVFRMPAIVEICGIDFYLNDTIGREKYINLDASKKMAADNLIGRMTLVDTELILPKNATGIEKANIAALQKIKSSSPAEWFERFLSEYNFHMETAHRDCDYDRKRKAVDVNDYLGIRNHISGMPYTISLLEYAEGNFQDYPYLESIGLLDQIERLKQAIGLFGCSSNDLFSFEKECIDEGSDSNLVAVQMLCNPDFKLFDALMDSTRLVGRIFHECVFLIADLREKANIIKTDMTNVASESEAAVPKIDGFLKYLEAIEYSLKAAWIWQVYTARYKRPGSIWAETNLEQVAFTAA